MDDNHQNSEIDERAGGAQVYLAPGKPLRRRPWWLALLVIPLAACVACAAVAFTYIYQSNRSGIPVTGGQPAIVSPLAPLATPRSSPAAPKKATPGPAILSYKDEAQNRLDTCSESFQNFFEMEQAVINQPDMMGSGKWRDDSSTAASSFRQDCEALGTMPAAPSAYSQVDAVLKQAAGEVSPAVDAFTSAVDQKDPLALRTSVRHMLRFIGYIHAVETMLSGIEDLKQI